MKLLMSLETVPSCFHFGGSSCCSSGCSIVARRKDDAPLWLEAWRACEAFSPFQFMSGRPVAFWTEDRKDVNEFWLVRFVLGSPGLPPPPPTPLPLLNRTNSRTQERNCSITEKLIKIQFNFFSRLLGPLQSV